MRKVIEFIYQCNLFERAQIQRKVLVQFPALNEDIHAISNQCQKQLKHGTFTRNMLEIMFESHKYSATASGKNTQMSYMVTQLAWWIQLVKSNLNFNILKSKLHQQILDLGSL